MTLKTYLQVTQPVRDLPFETLRLDPVMLESGIWGQPYGSLLAKEASRTQSHFLLSVTFGPQTMRHSPDADWMPAGQAIPFLSSATESFSLNGERIIG